MWVYIWRKCVKMITRKRRACECIFLTQNSFDSKCNEQTTPNVDYIFGDITHE